ncbi:MAG: GNAT family N-acetyltransferase [Solirubrobacteraceae bacterium]
MTTESIRTERLELSPLQPAAAAALPEQRAAAEDIIGAKLSPGWPQPDLLKILPRQATTAPEAAGYGIWVMIEPDPRIVVGDLGFHGPPDDGVVEIGYAVVSDRRRRGYATEAARALIDWALRQPGVAEIVAGCEETNEASITTLQRLGFSRTGQNGGEVRWRQ